MSDVYFIVIPVVIVVVILKLCLIFWRVWLYQKRRERIYLFQRTPQGCDARDVASQSSARLTGVERTLGPDGYTQRTSFVINQPGFPARQVTRTVTIRPTDNRRPDNPNLPPSYHHAVTGKDKSVKVQDGTSTAIDDRPSASPPPFQAIPPETANFPPPPAYTQVPTLAPVIDDNSDTNDNATQPLV